MTGAFQKVVACCDRNFDASSNFGWSVGSFLIAIARFIWATILLYFLMVWLAVAFIFTSPFIAEREKSQDQSLGVTQATPVAPAKPPLRHRFRLGRRTKSQS